MQVNSLLNTEFYTEGPAVDEEGVIYFTTLQGGKIMKVVPNESPLAWAETKCPNGQRILSNGDHLVCDSQLGKVIRFDASGRKIEDAAYGECEGVSIKAPNDLVVDEDSGFYFTDSIRYNGSIYFFGNNGANRLVATNIDYPNGICLSKDKTKLFVAESYKNRILIINLKEPGIPMSLPEIFCVLPMNKKNTAATGNLPDGIVTDDSDQIWVAHYGMQAVQLISSQGALISSFDTGIPLTSNLCFTKDCCKLIVTGGSGEPGPGNVKILSF